MPAAKFGAECRVPCPYAVRDDDGNAAHRKRTLWEMNVLADTREQVYELHWMRHAERYIALVRAALDKDPDDEQLLELLQAMEAALAKKLKQPLH
jgi:hypothetical protein